MTLDQQKISIPSAIVVRDLAEILDTSPVEVVKALMQNGVMATVVQVIDFETAAIIAEDFGFSVDTETEKELPDLGNEAAAESTSLRLVENDPDAVARPPVVTVLGHVDHGKTTLLDHIRSANVQESEAGGITQHIGAYQVEVDGGRMITFLDTPGHEAFTQMRARGANVTDVGIVVVAADDGLMQQTREAIAHVKAAQVPLVIAINKVDLPNSDPAKIKGQLTEVDLLPEDLGGDQIVVEISALEGLGVDDLLESVLLIADLEELKANPDNEPRGIILEAKNDRQRGVTATLLVQTGTLRSGDIVLAGTSFGRIKAMFGSDGSKIESAGPSAPVEILGLSAVPQAGEVFEIRADSRTARLEAERRLRGVDVGGVTQPVTLDSLFGEIRRGNVKDFNLVVKADVQGSIEPLVQVIDSQSHEEVNVRVIHAAVGSVVESDIQLATASQGVVIAFNVTSEPGARKLASEDHIEVREYSVIYDIVDDIQKAVQGLLDPIFEDRQDGVAEVRAVFRKGRRNAIAGCYIREGSVSRGSLCRVMRNGSVLHESNLDTLKRESDAAREVVTGLECGITVSGYESFEEGDEIVTYHKEQIR